MNLRLGENKIEAAWVSCSPRCSQLCPRRQGYQGQACGHPWRLSWEPSGRQARKTAPKRPIAFICKVIITPPIFYKPTSKQIMVTWKQKWQVPPWNGIHSFSFFPPFYLKEQFVLFILLQNKWNHNFRSTICVTNFMNVIRFCFFSGSTKFYSLRAVKM